MNIILFTPDEIGKPLPKRDARAIHLIKVLRKKEGDIFDAGILGGDSGDGKIEAINPNNDGSIVFSFIAKKNAQERFPIRIGIGFPRPIQIRRILRDLSSLGVSAIDFFGSELGEKSYRDTNLFNDGGAKESLIEGAIQSRDTTIPIVNTYNTIYDWLKVCKTNSWNISDNKNTPLLIAADNINSSGSMSEISTEKKSAIIAIGPERGFSNHEREILETNKFFRLSLGKRALRSETACIAAAIIALEKIGLLC